MISKICCYKQLPYRIKAPILHIIRALEDIFMKLTKLIVLLTTLTLCACGSKPNKESQEGGDKSQPTSQVVGESSDKTGNSDEVSSEQPKSSKKTAAEIGAEDMNKIDDFFAPIFKAIMGKDAVKSDNEHTPYDYSLAYSDIMERVTLNAVINLKEKATTLEEAFNIVDAAIGSKATKQRAASEYRNASNKVRYGTDYTLVLPDDNAIITVEALFAEYGSSLFGYETGDLITTIDCYHYIIV